MKRTKGNSLFKGKVVHNIKKWNRECREEKKRFNREVFSHIKPKRVIFSNNVGMENCYVYLPKSLFTELSRPAIAVYPVLCIKANFKEDNWYHISQDNIAKYAGVGIITATKGIEQLIEYGFVKRRKKTVDMIHIYEYRVKFYRGDDINNYKGDLLQFYHNIVLNGAWARLGPDEKKLYMVMRSIARFEPDTYSYLEGVELDGLALNEFYSTEYSKRKWDVIYTAESFDEHGYLMLMLLSEESSMSIKRVQRALVRLENKNFIEQVFDYCYKVYLKLEYDDISV